MMSGECWRDPCPFFLMIGIYNCNKVILKLIELKMHKIFKQYSKLNKLTKHRFIRNSIWSIIDQVLGLTLALLITIALARQFGPTELGKYILAISLTSLISVLTNLGIQTAVKRVIAKDPKKTEEYLGQAIAIRFIFSLPMSCLCVQAAAIILAYDRDLIVICHIANLFIFFSGLIALNAAVLTSLHLSKKVLLFNIIYRLGILVLLILVVITHSTINSYLFGMAVVGLFVFLMGTLDIIKQTGTLILKPKIKFCKNLVVTSFPLALAAAIEFANLKIDTLFIGSIIDEQSVGIYAAGFNIILAFIAIPMAITKVFFPNFIEIINSQNYSLARNSVIKLSFVYILYSLTCTIFIFFAADIFVFVLYGEAFMETANIIKLLAVSIPFIVLNRLYNYLLVALDFDKVLYKVISVGLIANIALNIFLIPKFSIYGAAFATIFSETLVLILMIIILLKYSRDQIFTS